MEQALQNIANFVEQNLAAQQVLNQQLLLQQQQQQQNQNQQQQQPVARDEHGRTAAEAHKDFVEFANKKPTFERGTSRWADFAYLFARSRERYRATDVQAKEVLYEAIVGQSGRLVISSMSPRNAEYVNMEFDEYMRLMGEKFTPAAESLQMKSEYKSRIQGKSEDVQNYLNAKYELFRLAYPNAQDMADFYSEATRGILNKYVRDNMWRYRAENFAAFGAEAVALVQIERQRIAYGDSEDRSMLGLIPVTRTPQRVNEKGEPMEVDALAHREEGYEDEEEEENPDFCECMALHESGFRGPCYYCQQRGHMLRNCPRKSAGLPKVYNRGGGTYGRGRGAPMSNRGYTPTNRGRGRGGYNHGTYPNRGGNTRVNHIEKESEEAEVPADEQALEGEDEAAAAVDFLGELTL